MIGQWFDSICVSETCDVLCAGGAAAAGAGGLAGQHQLRELRAPHHAGLTRRAPRTPRSRRLLNETYDSVYVFPFECIPKLIIILYNVCTVNK